MAAWRLVGHVAFVSSAVVLITVLSFTWISKILKLLVQSKIIADDSLIYLYLFLKKTRFNISYKLSPSQAIYMKYKPHFLNEKIFQNLIPAAVIGNL